MTAKEGIYQFKNELLDVPLFDPLLKVWDELFTEEYYDEWFIRGYNNKLYWYETYESLMQSELPDAYDDEFKQIIFNDFKTDMTARFGMPIVPNLTEAQILDQVRRWATNYETDQADDILQELFGMSGMTAMAYNQLDRQFRKMIKETISMDYVKRHFKVELAPGTDPKLYPMYSVEPR